MNDSHPTKPVVDRMALLSRLGDTFPGVAIDARTYRAYAEALKDVDLREIERAVQECMHECDRFPSLSKIAKAAKRREKAKRTGWGNDRPVMFVDEVAKLVAGEYRWMLELSDLQWRILKGPLREETTAPYGIDGFGNALYEDLPAPQTHWESAQVFRNFYNAIRARTGGARPRMEVM